MKNARESDREQTPDNLFAAGQNFAALGDTTRAEQYLSAAIEKGADEKKVLPLLLEVCVRDGRFEMAIEYARPYVEKHPYDTRVRYLLATIYAAVGDADHAHDEITSVVTARPNDADPHYLLGVVLRQQKDLIGADAQFREYLRISPQGAHADEAREALLKEVPSISNKTNDPTDGGAPTLIGPANTVEAIADASVNGAADSGKKSKKP